MTQPDNTLRLTLLDKCAGDVDKAKAMYAWVTENQVTPEPLPSPDGIVLTEQEIMGSEPEALMALAMKRLAELQNQPQK